MKFVTYAQNFEDLMLYRALKHVENGFYIDLGAAEPEAHSVTKAFYDRGWHGINVEPGASPFERLMAARQRDININLGIWSTKGELQMYFVGDDTELSTTNAWLMEQHKAAGMPIREETINVTTLTHLCEEYVAAREIHFMKIDVEGAEVEALKGHDFNRWRPWIILVESHEPERISKHWEPVRDLLLSQEYSFVYCDGLNRFYVSTEKLETLRPAFEVPPNIYDNWIRAEERDLEERCVHAEVTRATAWRELEIAQARVHVVEEELKVLRQSMAT